MVNSSRAAAVAAALLLALAGTARAHDIPNDVTVQAFLRPAGQRLQLLVRVPMKAMRDIDYPKRGGSYVDLARVDRALRDAALLWVTPAIVLNEGGERLPEPQIVESRMSIESDKSFASFESALAHVQGARLRVCEGHPHRSGPT